MKWHKRRSRGQSLVEMVFIMPILLLICFFILTMGMLFYSKIMIVLASSQGARVGAQIWKSTEYTEEEKNTKVEKVVNGVLSGSSVRNVQSLVVEEIDGALNVAIVYEYQLILPFASMFFEGSNLLLEHRAIYYIEGG